LSRISSASSPIWSIDQIGEEADEILDKARRAQVELPY
jgi:hypothetical protein